MKKLIVGITLAFTLMMTVPAMAFWGGGDTINNDNSINNAANATAISSATGGNATIEKGAVKVDNKNTNINTNMNTNINSNKNENKNTNLNCNTNKQGQAQGQMQGQGQAQKNELTIIEAETKRNHISGSAFTATVGSYGDRYERGAEFEEVSVLTAIKKNFSFEAAYEDYGKKYGEGKCKTIGHSYNGRHEDNPSESIEVYTLENIQYNERNFEVIGFLTVKAIKEGIDSFMVMQKGVLSAAIMQGDGFVVTDEGAAYRPKSKGWGIGTFFTGGQVADHGNRGDATTGGGGTGFSSTSSELVTLPWMTIQVFKYTD